MLAANAPVKQITLAFAVARRHICCSNFARREPNLLVGLGTFTLRADPQSVPRQTARGVGSESFEVDPELAQARRIGFGGGVELGQPAAAKVYRNIERLRAAPRRRRIEINDWRFQPHGHV